MAVEKLDLDDLDAEDMKALDEVSKKGYYHARPKSEAAPAPERIENASDGPQPISGEEVAQVKRAQYDDFQKKWDRFDADDEADENTAAGGGQSSATRVHRPAPPAPLVADEGIVAQLMGMGFGEQESRAAALATKNRADAAVDYLIGGGSVGINSPARTQADPSMMAMLVEMGFSERHSREALEACKNELDRAVERAADLTSKDSASRFTSARDALRKLEADVVALESDGSGPPDAKRVRLLEEALTQASCSLDAVDVASGAASREERRIELDRCNVLDTRIVALRSATSAGGGACASAATSTAGHEAPGSAVTAEDMGAAANMDVDAGVSSQDGAANRDGSIADGPSPASTREHLEVAAEAPHKAETPQTLASEATVYHSCCPRCSRSWALPEPEGGCCPDCGVEVQMKAGALSTPSPAQERIIKAEELRLAGNTAFKAEEYAAAVTSYFAALELDADNVAILSNLAAAELKMGEFESAATHAAAANELSGGFSAKALFRKGQALEGMRQFVEASDAYQAALAVEPNDKLVRHRLQECCKVVAAAATTSPPAG